MIQWVVVIVALYLNDHVGSALHPIADAIQRSEVDQSSIESGDPSSSEIITLHPAKQYVVVENPFPHFPLLTGKVVDEAEIIGSADEQALNDQLAMY